RDGRDVHRDALARPPRTLESMTTPLTRRRALTMLGAGGVVITAAACGGSSRKTSASSSTTTSSSTTAAASGVKTCVLSPEMTEGPYYISGEAVRTDITEGHPGTPLRLALTAVDVTTRSEEHTSELQSLAYLVCRLLLE